MITNNDTRYKKCTQHIKDTQNLQSHLSFKKDSNCKEEFCSQFSKFYKGSIVIQANKVFVSLDTSEATLGNSSIKNKLCTLGNNISMHCMHR